LFFHPYCRRKKIKLLPEIVWDTLAAAALLHDAVKIHLMTPGYHRNVCLNPKVAQIVEGLNKKYHWYKKTQCFRHKRISVKLLTLNDDVLHLIN
jgi:hypothetical protein